MYDINKEDARTLLGIAEQRRQHLSNAISTLNGLAITVIIAIWTFCVSSFMDYSSFLNSTSKNPQAQTFAFAYIIFASGISSVMLIFWRWYVKYLDNNIANLYPEIMTYESILGVKSDKGISGYLLKNTFQKKVNGDRRKDIEELTYEKRISLISQLVDNKRAGTRGHKWIDNLFFIAIICFFVIIGIDIWYIFRNEMMQEMFEICNYPLSLLKFVGYLLTILGLIAEFFIVTKYQREPGLKYLEKILNDINNNTKSEKIQNTQI